MTSMSKLFGCTVDQWGHSDSQV